MTTETIVLGAIGVIIPIITTVIGKYISSLIKAQEDQKKEFEDYKEKDAAIEKLQDERILTLQTRQEQKMIRLNALEAVIREDRKDLTAQIRALSDTIIGLTSTIKHLEEKINDLKLT